MKKILIIVFVFLSLSLFAQQKQLAHDNLDSFETQKGNWSIVGEVIMNPTIDENSKTYLNTELSKKRKRRKKKQEKEIPVAVTFKEGKGILLNVDNSLKNSELTTKWSHGDIELEMDVMVAKGSNSGIYFQGKYKIQIKDSWDAKRPKYSDFGGIFKNNVTEGEMIFKGIPPLSNAAKAPGLWQHLKIHFQAPKFNASGLKIMNAKFISVELNGVRIHSNVEVPYATEGASSELEVSKGPLIIKADHGSIAFKNIKYLLLEESQVRLNNLKYTVYKGAYKGLDEIDKYPVFSEGTTNTINVHLAKEENDYALIFQGVLTIPKDDKYTFNVPYSGGVELLIDNESVLKNNSAQDNGTLEKTISLSKGNHALTIVNVKSAPWHAEKLGLIIQTPNTNPKTFHAYESFPSISTAGSPILVDPGSDPRLLRGFVDFCTDDAKERLSHTIGVGIPAGVNFIYNLETGNIVGVWRGDFLDATPMWHSRGDGSFKPNGAVQWTFLDQPLANLETPEAKFPRKTELPNFRPKGYTMDHNTGLPIFKHSYKGVDIENRIAPNTKNTYLIHEVRFSKVGLVNWYYKLAEGNIKLMADGSYAIKNQKYYIKLLSDQNIKIRGSGDTSELIVPVDGSTIKYEIVW